MSTQPTHPDAADPHTTANRQWCPPATEPQLLASFWQGYDSLDTCIVYDSQPDSGDAWVESSLVYRRNDCR